MASSERDPAGDIAWSRIWPWLLALGATGGLLVGGGALSRDGSYLQSIFGNLGTTLVLAVPLVLVGFGIERRLTAKQEATAKAVRAGVASVRGDVDTLSADINARVQAALAEQDAKAQEPVERFINHRFSGGALDGV